MNQRRYIENQHKLTTIELDNIKKQIKNELNEQNNQTDSVADDVFVEEANNSCEESNEDEIEPSKNPSEIEDLVKEIKKAIAEWENIRMAERPPLPKISVNRKAELLIKQANQAIQLVIAEEAPNLNKINICYNMSLRMWYLKSWVKRQNSQRQRAINGTNQNGGQE